MLLLWFQPGPGAPARVRLAWRQLLALVVSVPVGCAVVGIVHLAAVRLVACLLVVGALWAMPDRIEVLREHRDETRYPPGW